ncbi:MAG: imelysin family protein [Candidatus Cryptobacteroides sp.]
MRKSRTLFLLTAVLLSSCLKKVEPNPSETKETAFMYIMNSYARGTGTSNFKSLADNATLLANNCVLASYKVASGAFTDAEVKEICDNWTSSRECWMKGLSLPVYSEAGKDIQKKLGTQADTTGIKESIGKIEAGEELDLLKLPDNQRGFAAAEFMLFKISDGKSVRHDVNYTASEMTYLCAVTAEIRLLCTQLYADWEGKDNIADIYADLLNKNGVTVETKGYAWELLNPGTEGSRFSSYQEGILSLLKGCMDFTEQFGKEILGKEISPLSRNSVTDFKSALNGINYCYSGKISNQASISTFTKAWSPDLDTQTRNLITEIQNGLAKLTEPLSECTEDIDALAGKTGTDLPASLQAVYEFLAGL